MTNIAPHIELVLGPMWSGKTSELIRRRRVYEAADLMVQCFKPKKDDRYDQKYIVSHDGSSIDATPVGSVDEFLGYLRKETDILIWEEVQFMDQNLANVVDNLVAEGRITAAVVAGLHRNANRDLWPTVEAFMTVADHYTFLTAMCRHRETPDAKVCGATANDTVFLGEPPKTGDRQLIMVGAEDLYSPRCRLHYNLFVSQQ